MEINRTLKASVVVGLVCFGVSSPSVAGTYYKCKSGFQFQTTSDAARCYKPARNTYKAPNACGNVTVPGANVSVGHFLQRDYQGNADKCVGTFKVGPMKNTNVLALACPNGYRLEVRDGADRCKKRIGAKVEAASVKVSR